MAPHPKSRVQKRIGEGYVEARPRPSSGKVAPVGEDKARALDVPPYKVLGPEVLLDIARGKPRSVAELASIKGARQGRRAMSIADEIVRAVTAGVADPTLPEADRALLERPRPPLNLTRARRAREQRLTKWRREEAKRRGVDEQVILPGHCLQELADLDEVSLEAVAGVPGIGAFRVARYGEAILAAIVSPGAEAAS